MRLAGGCSALAGAAVLLLAGCASGAGAKASVVSRGGPTSSAVPVPSSIAIIRPSGSASASTTASASAPAASAVAQAKADQTKFPKAKLYPPSARPGAATPGSRPS